MAGNGQLGGRSEQGKTAGDKFLTMLGRRRRYTSATQIAVDGVAWVVALYAATLFRYDFNVSRARLRSFQPLLRDPNSSYIPVGLIDDDPGKRKLRIMGIPVLGDRTRLVEAAKECRADSLLIAMPSAGPDLVTGAS